MTDEQVAKINELVNKCKNKTSGVCALQVLPCERVIDTGRCPVIIDYLEKERSNGR